MNAGQRMSDRLRLPERMATVYDSLSLEGVNDYISRTGGSESFPLVAGAAAIGLVGQISSYFSYEYFIAKCWIQIYR